MPAVLSARRGIKDELADGPPSDEALPADGSPAAEASGPRRPADTMLGRLKAAGCPVERLAGSREDGADEWCWEREDRARAVVADEADRRSDGEGPPEEAGAGCP